MKFGGLFLQLLGSGLATVHPHEPHQCGKWLEIPTVRLFYLLSSAQRGAEQIQEMYYFVSATGKSSFLRAWGEHVPQLG